MEIRPEVIDVVVGRNLFWNKTEENETGRWIIKLRYDRGPMTSAKVDTIYFNHEQEARYWFDHIWENIFVKIFKIPPPPPPKNKVSKLPVKGPKKGSHLRLV